MSEKPRRRRRRKEPAAEPTPEKRESITPTPEEVVAAVQMGWPSLLEGAGCTMEHLAKRVFALTTSGNDNTALSATIFGFKVYGFTERQTHSVEGSVTLAWEDE